MGSGNRSIRFKIFLLLLLPLLSLSALWGFVLNLTVGDGTALLRADALYEMVGAASTELGSQLQAERSQSSVAITSRVLTSGIGEQRSRTDLAVRRFRDAARGYRPATAELRVSVNETLGKLDGLREIRAGIDDGQSTRLSVLSSYNQILDSVFLLYSQLVAVPDLMVFQQATAMQVMGNAREMMARESALISGALIDSRLSPEERTAFAEYAATREFLHARGLSALDVTLGRPYRETLSSTAFEKFTAMERAIVSGTGDRLPAEAGRWSEVVNPLANWLDRLGAASGTALAEQSGSLATGIVIRIAVAGGAGLVAVIASIVISVRFGRRLAGELAGLRSTALDLADVRLPRLVTRLRHGEEVDVEAEAPAIEPRGSAEIRDVARAFGSVQRTAVEAAVGQARLRRGVSQVFVNLARRKQGLLHRQLALLDSMQRRATDPDSLDDLFRLDHLTTRMRRHAEGLIILSGAAPGRVWHRPVPVVDAVRAAIAEVEDYKRVNVAPLPDVMLDGGAVADIAHLIAELIENATVYSPPQTMVTVRGEMVANGFAVEVEDRGLGLGSAEYAEINARLADPPEFDLADSDRLGLFVVGRLAARHGIQIVLRASSFGGTTAIVLIPRGVIAEAAPVSVTAERLTGRAELPEAASTAALAPAPSAGTGLPRRTRTVPRNPEPASPPLAAPTLTVVADPSRAAGTGGTSRTDDAEAPVRETTGPGNLPRRVRQANLAPQLRQDDPAPDGPGGSTGPAGREPEPEPAGRRPEEARALFSAFQAGTRRGREDHGNDFASDKSGEKEDT
ncbi:nitrate- and nitrite sensing domain-containing protein [Planomonospora sp. ID67723]|uniref:sensor histidine kinase n=1 Tax=Planomonospora sp. ID67723 TaxID=2738134 RepID=UPI0018C3FD8E|nr:nitrate- and nitrite sensing domain-containing protein [Planomonospora sp. ID67723]MBG0827178.1 nitrate- and nitrite sensing domain-containing protein [Planomonospora sp. ID67723]